MKKIALIGGILILVGGLIAFGAVWFVQFDWNSFSTERVISETVPIDGAFTSIEASTAGCDLTAAPAADDACSVLYTGSERFYRSFTVENGILRAECRSNDAWFGIHTTQEKLTLYLPETQYEALMVETASGDVHIPSDFIFASAQIRTASGDVTLSARVRNELSVNTASGDVCVTDTPAQTVKLTTASGEVYVKDAKAKTVQLTTTSGDISAADMSADSVTVTTVSSEVCLKNTVAARTMDVTTTSGDVLLTDSDAAEVTVETASGDVCGTLLTPKAFYCTSVSGDINAPASAAGDPCTVSTTSGEISLRISKQP